MKASGSGNNIIETQSVAGRGFAVPFRNLGISNGLRRCLKAKQCKEQLGFASDNSLTLLNNIASPRQDILSDSSKVTAHPLPAADCFFKFNNCSLHCTKRKCYRIK